MAQSEARRIGNTTPLSLIRYCHLKRTAHCGLPRLLETSISTLFADSRRTQQRGRSFPFSVDLASKLDATARLRDWLWVMQGAPDPELLVLGRLLSGFETDCTICCWLSRPCLNQLVVVILISRCRIYLWIDCRLESEQYEVKL